jgi:NAD(P)-dependent dehydrogenase (short-subunit alcohol dehydrogenase family)
MRFAGKRAAITGAASGIGAAVARAIAAEGASAIALVDRRASGLETIAGGIGARPPLTCDISICSVASAGRHSIRGMASTSWSRLPPCWVSQRDRRLQPDVWDSVFATNVGHVSRRALHSAHAQERRWVDRHDQFRGRADRLAAAAMQRVESRRHSLTRSMAVPRAG